MSQEPKEKMSPEKVSRLAVGATVAGVLLILCLVVVIVIQAVSAGVKNKRLDEYRQQLEEYEQLEEDTEKKLDWYREGRGLYWYARSHGYT